MLSAILFVPAPVAREPARPMPDALVRSLSSLVPAAIEGVLRDVTISAGAGYEGMAAIADHAGCELCEAESGRAAFLKALAGTRENNVFVLLAGRAPESGFADELAETIGEGRAIARMRERPYNFASRLFPALAPVAAILAPRQKLESAAASDFRQLASSFRSAPTLRMRARRVD